MMDESSYYRLVSLRDGTEIALLGTAHVSQTSVDDVNKAFESFKPDTMCVEIDQGRLDNLNDPESWKKLDIFSVLRKKQGFLLMANLTLSGYQRKVSANMGSTAGAEMKQACDLASLHQLNLELCDRPIGTTLRRAWAKSSFWAKNKLLVGLLAGAFENEVVSEEEIDALKQGDHLSDMMNDLAKEAPVVKEVLLDERDQYLAKKIYQSKGKRRLAVLGAGHLAGVEKLLKELDNGLIIDEEALNVVPPKKMISKLLPLLFPLAIIGLLVYGFVGIDIDTGISALKRWFLITGIPSAIGGILALANPLTILAAFLAAPFTTLHPAIGIGMVTGLVEASVNRPKVADLESLVTDASSLKGFYHNRVLKILLVFFLTSLGATIGNLAGFGSLINQFIK